MLTQLELSNKREVLDDCRYLLYDINLLKSKCC